MKKIPKFVWVLLGLIVAAYVAWDAAYPSGTLRYKMTVTVETPEGIKTGSAVREVAFSSQPRIVPGVHGFIAEVSKGEAVVVDLGKRGVLFALIPGVQVVYDAFPVPGDKSPLSATGLRYYHLDADGIRYYRSLNTGKAILLPMQYPMFVQFKNINDPMTVEQVCEKAFCDQVLQELHRKTTDFNQLGVSVKEVTIEITLEPVMTGIEKWLPWLHGIKDGIDGTSVVTSNALSNKLNLWDFEREKR